MEDSQHDIESLLSDAGDYIETRTTLLKYKGIESLADVSGELASGLGMIGIVSFVIIIFSIGAALLIGDWLGRSCYGFFVIGGFYTLLAIIIYARRTSLLKSRFSNMLIRKILK